MADFDPDAYLAASPPPSGGGFDPDAYLKGSAPPPVPTGGFNAATAADVGKSAGIGVVKGVIGLAGLPGDIASGFNRGVDWVESKIGLTPQPRSGALTSGQLTRGVESVTGPLYEPKTKAGQYAQTVGEFVPGMIGGPEGLAYKAATRVLAPAVASETAGQATEGTALEPYARVAGALVGHGAGAGAARAATAERAAVPTLEELHDAYTQNYTNARGYGVELKRQPVARLSDDMLSELGNDGFRERNIPKTWSAIEELKNPAGKTVTIDDIESVRKALLRAGANPMEGAEREASRRAIASIDKHMATLDPREAAINPHYVGDLVAEMRDARGNYAAHARGKLLQEKEEAALDRAGATGAGANINNVIRQNIASILRSKKLQRGFSDDEIAQMRRIVRGTFIGNASRLLGKLAPTGVVSGSLGLELGSHLLGGPMGLSAVPIVGSIAKKIGEASTARGVRRLDEMVRSRSPLGRALPQPPPAPVVSNVERANVGLLGRNPGEDAHHEPLRLTVGPRADTPFAKGGAVTPPLSTRKESHYASDRGKPGHKCGVCAHYRKPNKCELVGGFIAAGGLCDWFKSAD